MASPHDRGEAYIYGHIEVGKRSCSPFFFRRVPCVAQGWPRFFFCTEPGLELFELESRCCWYCRSCRRYVCLYVCFQMRLRCASAARAGAAQTLTSRLCNHILCVDCRGWTGQSALLIYIYFPCRYILEWAALYADTRPRMIFLCTGLWAMLSQDVLGYLSRLRLARRGTSCSFFFHAAGARCRCGTPVNLSVSE